MEPDLFELSLAVLDSDLAWCHAARMAAVSRERRQIVNAWRSGLRSLQVATVASDAEMWLVASRCANLRELSVRPLDADDPPTGSYVLSGFALRAIGFGCPRLESVRFSCTDEMHDRDVSALVRGLRQLRALTMDNDTDVVFLRLPNLDGRFLLSVAECPLLEQLVLPEAFVIENSTHFAALGAGCSQLRELHSTFAGISSAMLSALASGCPRLRYLDLSHAAMEDAGVMALARHCPQLEVLLLDCGSDRKLSDASIVPLARSCPHLRSLNLFAATASEGEGGRALTDAAVLALGAHCMQLTDLSLGHAVRITDVAARCLLDAFPALARLDLWNCAGLTEKYREPLDRKVGFQPKGLSRWVANTVREG